MQPARDDQQCGGGRSTRCIRRRTAPDLRSSVPSRTGKGLQDQQNGRQQEPVEVEEADDPPGEIAGGPGAGPGLGGAAAKSESRVAAPG